MESRMDEQIKGAYAREKAREEGLASSPECRTLTKNQEKAQRRKNRKRRRK